MSEQSQKCPVCGWENGETAAEVNVAEKTVTVCCDECAQALAADPAKYLAR